MHRLTHAEPRSVLGRFLALVAILLMVYGAFWPVFDTLPGRGAQVMAMIAAATTLAAIIAPTGSRLALSLLWAAFGMACAVGIVGIFSIGYVYLAAAVVLILAIVATPNRSDLELKFDWHYIAAFYAGFLSIFVGFLV